MGFIHLIELLGLISYFLINYWSSKVNNGIKSIIYNKIGDINFIIVLGGSSSLLSIDYYLYIPIFQLLIHQLFKFIIYFILYFNLGISIILIFFSKSAQLPFLSWLLNAMSAPTPISALLHSSTMVIAGVYFGIILSDTLLILIDISFITLFLFFVSTLLTMIFSLFKSISLTDMKSIIAFSTISQISYMFIGLIIIPLISIYHIIIHAL